MAKRRSACLRERAGTKSVGGLIVLAFAAFVIVVPSVSGADEVVTVHASDTLGPFVAPVGFICGVDQQEKWPDEVMVAALNPKHWRLSKIQSYEAAAQHPGIEITYVISDPYGYSVGYPNATPWTDWEWYESYVQYIVQSRSEWFPEHPVAFWDVWNEPDHPYFWSGTYEQLLELFARTYNVIKAEDPSALVVGPSLSCFDPNSGGL